MITNLDVEGFAIESYSVWGMKGSQDPPATTAGFLNLEVLSGDPKDGPLHMFPFLSSRRTWNCYSILTIY